MKYSVIWSEEDGQYVGLCDEYPSLSWLDDSKDRALMGIMEVVEDEKRHEKELCTEDDAGSHGVESKK